MRQRLSVEAKEAIIKQALGKSCRGIAEIAEKNNVGYSTLQKWLRAIREEKPLCKSESKPSKQAVSRADYLNHLLATVQLDETALGAYCREHGIYSHQLTTWKEELMTTPEKTKNEKQLKELRALKTENQALKKELRRKDMALAETSALLILKKKAALIWGEREDD